MAGKASKTNVAARREEREAQKNQTCLRCGNQIEMAMMVNGRGKTQMVRMCCQKAQAE
ncbi:MAG: hypothetical protein UT24_C0018G0021 [Candidatus Woesebacteria bacterium GW2011_GWB1_39_12]|uniref:Uncharacterized protein n=1 Tax=Candidatus Woesebacteria bacterium GW2011_GWB1_39_12 TaxID=1618574 RepID=A0A0G0M7A7_9BACT|nr:MAG: hypothetical protein UT24_C0018G0021 [Candidatus Woesebacteria bacterium GW2011_GWB1_39_12]